MLGDDPIAGPVITVNNLEITLSRGSNVISGSKYRVNDHVTTQSSYTLSQQSVQTAE